jgi:hypothetical protein
MLLKDGTRIHRGDPILKLHLWNEHMPSMGDRGPSVAWGRQVSRSMDRSLAELAGYLGQQSHLSDVKAICADMCLGTAARRAQLARIVGHFGFEAALPGLGRVGPLERVAQNIMMFLLVLVTNPSTLRGEILLRTHQRIFLSRRSLLHRYAEERLPLQATLPLPKRQVTLQPGELPGQKLQWEAALAKHASTGAIHRGHEASL